MSHNVLVLPGDGIGPEVLSSARRILDIVHPGVIYSTCDVGISALKSTGRPYPVDLVDRARASDAVLFGAVGGDQDTDAPWDLRPEAALFTLRRELDLFANLRPIRSIPALLDRSAVRADLAGGVDILIVRELVGGAYFGAKGIRDDGTAFDTFEYSRDSIARVVRVAFELAQGRGARVTSVDKANILRTSQLWRKVAGEMSEEFAGTTLEHLLVDNAALQLLVRPRSFDVVVTENLFGDILSDSTAAIVGGLGMLPSASLGSGVPGLFEPVHGSAPDIAGRGIANPFAAILTVGMLLRYAFQDTDGADRVERAVDSAIESGARTPDIGGVASTVEVTEAVIQALVSI
jgi:3-isopropylmalate dehydrogenase